jgi:hypothetical protein
MEIDLSKIPSGQVDNPYDLDRMKAGYIMKDINKLNESCEIKYNYMIIPMHVYNILEHHPSFLNVKIKDSDPDGLWKVGTIFGYECYLDMYMPTNQISVYYDKQIARNLKLDSILEGRIIPETKVDITIIDLYT